MSETHDLGPIEDALLEEVVENMIFQNQVVSDQIVFTNSEGDQMVGRFQQTTPGTWEWVRSYSE